MGGFSNKFATDLLHALGYASTAENIRFLSAWARAEGGHAAYNPFNTTEGWSGASDYNSVGVKNYASYSDGLRATVATLRNGRYGGILAGLKSGASAMTTAQALAASPWGTGSLVEKVLGGGGGSGGGSVSTSSVTGAPAPDKLSMGELADNYGWEAGLLKSIPELRSLLQRAFNDPQGQWTTQKFKLALENTDWWKTHGSAARLAANQQYADPASYRAGVAQKQQDVAALAAGMGAGLTAAALSKIAARAYVYNLDEAQIRQALSGFIAYSKDGALAGDAAAQAENLRQIAYQNGLKVSDGYILAAAQHIEGGRATADSYAAHLRQMAASAFPQFKDQIMAGQNMSDIASPYMQSMASTLELDPANLDLFDPTIRKALMGSLDPKTNEQTAQPLWAFENSLRQDPRWMQTNNARESLLGVGRGVLQSFGLAS